MREILSRGVRAGIRRPVRCTLHSGHGASPGTTTDVRTQRLVGTPGHFRECPLYISGFPVAARRPFGAFGPMWTGVRSGSAQTAQRRDGCL